MCSSVCPCVCPRVRPVCVSVCPSHLADVGRDEVADEGLHVGVDGAPLLDGGHDGGEVVVGQDLGFTGLSRSFKIIGFLI